MLETVAEWLRRELTIPGGGVLAWALIAFLMVGVVWFFAEERREALRRKMRQEYDAGYYAGIKAANRKVREVLDLLGPELREAYREAHKASYYVEPEKALEAIRASKASAENHVN